MPIQLSFDPSSKERPERRKKKVTTKVMPPTYLLAAIALTVAVHFLVPLAAPLSFGWRFVGLLPLAIGGLLNVAADREFKRVGTTVKPFQSSSSLVTHGVFRLTRNPMYLGMVFIVAGVALIEGSVSPWIVVCVLAVILDRVFIVPEEKMLRETFGDTYDAYSRRVRRCL
jgi:protein-S-isoprenylcysteine O-methyltransferase Ste14